MFALMAEYEAALIKERTLARAGRSAGPWPHRRPQTQDDGELSPDQQGSQYWQRPVIK
jgi:hypothetical protein